MENKSFEQLKRMLKLINHKQINKVNINEAIKKADKSGILLKESEPAPFSIDSLNLDFLVGNEVQDFKDAAAIINSGDRGDRYKFYNPGLSAKLGSRDFDMLYRMWLLRVPVGIMEAKITNYNNHQTNDSNKVIFPEDVKTWISDNEKKTKVSLGSMGIAGHTTDIGMFILEFMCRVYSGKLNPNEAKFDKIGTPVFTTDEAKKEAKYFLEKFLSAVVFKMALAVTKANFNNEVKTNMLVGAKQPAVDKVLNDMVKSYNVEKGNFAAWAIVNMKNFIINKFREFGDINTDDSGQIFEFASSLKYPYAVQSSVEFFNKILNLEKKVKHKFTTKDWEDLKDHSNSSYVDVKKNGSSYYFIYDSAKDLIQDVLSANEVSSDSTTHGFAGYSPLQYRNIGDENKALRDVVFKSDLKPTGEGKHKDIIEITFPYMSNDIKKKATVTLSQSEFDSSDPKKSIKNFEPKEESEEFIEAMEKQNWAPLTDAYSAYQDKYGAFSRSQSFNVKDSDGNGEDEGGEGGEKEGKTQSTGEFSMRISSNDIEGVSSVEKSLKKLNISKQKLSKNNSPETEEIKQNIDKEIDILQDVLANKTSLTIQYMEEPNIKGSPESLYITSVKDGLGNEVSLDGEFKDYVEKKAKEDSINGSDKTDAQDLSSFGSTETQDFDKISDEERTKRIHSAFKGKEFFDKFAKVVENTKDGGENSLKRLKEATIGKLKKNGIKNPKIIKEFYSFITDLIKETIINDVKGIGDKSKENIKTIYERLFQEAMVNVSKISESEDEANKAKQSFFMRDNDLNIIAASIKKFIKAKSREKSSIYSKMNLDEAKKIMADLMKNLLIENLVKEVDAEYDIDLDEERISNHDGSTKVNDKENFIGSQVFGEDIGEIGKESNWSNGMYGVFSYGEQFPIYVYTNMPFQDQDGNIKNKDGKFRWFHNLEQYKFDIDKDGEKEVMSSVEKHKELLKPNSQTHGLTTATLHGMINSFKKKNKIKELSHISILPGEGAGVHYGHSDQTHDKRKD